MKGLGLEFAMIYKRISFILRVAKLPCTLANQPANQSILLTLLLFNSSDQILIHQQLCCSGLAYFKSFHVKFVMNITAEKEYNTVV